MEKVDIGDNDNSAQGQVISQNGSDQQEPLAVAGVAVEIVKEGDEDNGQAEVEVNHVELFNRPETIPSPSLEIKVVDDGNGVQGQGPSASGSVSIAQNGSDHQEPAAVANGVVINMEDDEVVEVIPEDNGPGGERNPLEMREVVESVLDWVPTEDLPGFRRVSKTWSEEACRLLQRKKPTKFVFLYEGVLQKYIQKMRKTSDFPVRKFEICLPLDEGENQKLLPTFFRKFGSQVNELELRPTYIYWHELAQILWKVPALHTLALRHLPLQLCCTPIVGGIAYESVKVLRLASMPMLPYNEEDARRRLTAVLNALPRLEVLQFLPFGNNNMKRAVENIILKVITSPDVCLHYLREIGLNLSLNQPALEIFSKKGLRLRRLDVALEEDICLSSWKDMLSSVARSLTELRITFPASFSFTQERSGEHPHDSILLLQNLEVLHIENFRWPHRFAQRLGTQVGTSLRSLNVNGMKDTHLLVIYQSIPNLVEMVLREAKCTDQGITGIVPEIRDWLMVTGMTADAGRFRQELYIGSLTHLRKLTIVGEQITDASVALGMVDLAKLKELRIGSPLITDLGVTIIAELLSTQLSLLDVRECPMLSPEVQTRLNREMLGEVGSMMNPWFDPGATVNHGQDLRIIRRPHREELSDLWLPLLTPDVEFLPEEAVLRRYKGIVARDEYIAGLRREQIETVEGNFHLEIIRDVWRCLEGWIAQNYKCVVLKITAIITLIVMVGLSLWFFA